MKNLSAAASTAADNVHCYFSSTSGGQHSAAPSASDVQQADFMAMPPPNIGMQQQESASRRFLPLTSIR
jgi:hypothetical protein